MVRAVRERVGELYEVRPFERRRHPGTRRITEAFDYQVTGDADEVVVTLRILGGDLVEKRVWALNNGKAEAIVVPSGRWELKGVTKIGPTTPFQRFQAPDRAVEGVLSWPGPGGRRITVYGPVRSPARGGDGFMEQARDTAIARVFGQ